MDLTQQLKEYEGTKSYQAKMKYYRDGKFWPYKDTLNYSTIGYGHLITKSESDSGKFINGITEEQADALLQQDIKIARAGVSTLGLKLPVDSRWNDFLVMMVFQLGLQGVRGFKKFLSALSNANYHTAIAEVKDSRWYKQTPYRVESMIDYVLRG